MAFWNIGNFFRKNKLLFFISLLCIFCSSLMIFFSAGLIYHYQQKSFSGDGHKQSVMINFNEQKCAENPITKSELVSFFKNGNIFDELDYFYCETYDFDNDGNVTDAYLFYTQYTNGNFYFSRSVKENWENDLLLTSGDLFTDEQEENGEKVALVSDNNNSDTVNAIGMDFKVVGRLNAEQGVYFIEDTYIPFNAVKDDQPFYHGIYFKYNTMMSIKDVEQLVNYAQNCFSDRIEFDNYSDYYDFDMANYYKTLGFSCILICLLSCFNFIMLYRYILTARAKEYAIMRICGATRPRLAFDFAGEILLLSFPVLLISAVVFQVFIRPYLVRLYEYSSGAYSAGLFAMVIIAYLAVTIICSVIMFITAAGCLPPLRRRTSTDSVGVEIPTESHP